MKEIGMFEAKTRFSEIARLVQQTGQPVRVTNRGQEMVDITPVSKPVKQRRSKAQAVALLSALGKTLPKTSAKQIKADIQQGRR
jgi:prevent-host-death family protein